MKSTWLLLIGIAIGALGSGTYIATSQRAAEAPNLSSQSGLESSGAAPRSETSREFRPLWNPNKGTKTKRVSSREQASQPTLAEADSPPPTEPARTITRPLISNTPRPVAGVEQPTREELVELAAQIERRANRELDRLSHLLDLSEEQQNRIFPLLARSSTSFHPALGVRVGEAETSNVTNLPQAEDSNSSNRSRKSIPTAAPDLNEPLLSKVADEKIHDILTAAQQQALEDELVDEDLWWSDIVGDLEDELDESSAIATGEDTGYEGNTGIGSLLKQATETGSED